MAIEWEYWGDFSSSRDLLEFYGGGPLNRGHYTLVDTKPIKKSIGISAKAVPKADMLAIQSAMESSGLTPQTYTLADGSTVTGIPTNFSATPIEHTELFSVKLTVRGDGSGDPLWSLYGDISKSKDFMEIYNPTPGSIGNYELLNIYPVKTNASISANGVTKAYADSIMNALASGTAQTFTLADGTSITGLLLSCGATLIQYTVLYDLKATIRIDGVAVGSGATGVTWYAYGSHSMERSLTEYHEAPNSGGYGAVTFYDLSLPKYTIAVSADNVPASAISSIMNLITGTTPVSSFSFGSAGTGIPVSASCEQIKMTNMYNVKVTLRVH